MTSEIRHYRLQDFWGGWFVGAFSPNVVHSEDVEVCIKRFKQGDSEPVHFQVQATEVTVIISGCCRIGDAELGPDDIVLIEPQIAVGFEAITDVTLVAVKTPSLPDDKRLGRPK